MVFSNEEKIMAKSERVGWFRHLQPFFIPNTCISLARERNKVNAPISDHPKYWQTTPPQFPRQNPTITSKNHAHFQLPTPSKSPPEKKLSPQAKKNCPGPSEKKPRLRPWRSTHPYTYVGNEVVGRVFSIPAGIPASSSEREHSD